jgi:hypothetical protein
LKFLLPQGVGDNFWVLSKIESVAKKYGATTIDVLLNCGDPSKPAQARALDFVRRFECVTNASMHVVGDGTFLKPGPVADERGYFRYLDDGPSSLPGVDFVMIPNGTLEKGIRLEHWLPEYEIDWDFPDKNLRFMMEEWSGSAQFLADTGPFAAFYLSGKSPNTVAGHNRNSLWTPSAWIELGRRIAKTGLKIVVFGADYDRDYYDELIKPHVDWVDTIGRWPLMTALAVIMRAKFMISYQCGLAMVPTYLGQKTLIFWRPHGDSLLPNAYVSCHEGMSTAWVSPKILAAGTYIPAFYGRHGVDWIVGELKNRGWL